MSAQKVPGHGLMTPNARNAWAALAAFAVLALIVGALAVPFRFESPSMYYKFGVDKLLLRTGKLVGLVAAVLLFGQLLLAGRINALDRVFSLPVLYRLHRLAAAALAAATLIHPALVLTADDMIIIPLQARYWPEWVGAGLVVLVLLQAVSSLWRRLFHMPYHWWQRLHRLVGIAATAALVVHVFYASETFQTQGPPRTALFVFAVGWLLLWIRVRWQASGPGRRRWTVSHIAAAGKDACAVTLAPAGRRPFSYAPGQFAFVSVRSRRLSKEAHPFTLSSTPTRSGGVQIIVRRCGDWTDHIGTVEEGDPVLVQGPFGRFTHLFDDARGREIVMIAGGIGVTPMLSMLRYMSDVKDSRPVTLIWSNRSEDRLFCRRELAAMRQQLSRFTWIPIFTRRDAGFGHFGRLDRPLLERLLADTPRSAAVYVCGPPEMIRQIRGALTRLGFSKRAVRQEAFGL